MQHTATKSIFRLRWKKKKRKKNYFYAKRRIKLKTPGIEILMHLKTKIFFTLIHCMEIEIGKKEKMIEGKERQRAKK